MYSCFLCTFFLLQCCSSLENTPVVRPVNRTSFYFLQHSQSSAKTASTNASSTVCGVADVYSKLLTITRSEGQSILDNWYDTACDSVVKYNLTEMLEVYGLECKSNVCSEDACQQLVNKLLDECGVAVNYLVDKEIALHNFTCMNSVLHNISQKPDLAVYLKSKLILIVEVHSCSRKFSFQNTIRKLILELMDVIRYYSHYSKNFRCYKGFVLPKLSTQRALFKNMAVIVCLEYKQFKFRYSLEAVPINDFKDKLLSVFEFNKSFFEEILITRCAIVPGLFIKLSEEEMKAVAEGAQDCSCKQEVAKEAVVFRVGKKFFKIPLRYEEDKCLESYVSEIAISKQRNKCITNLIVIETVSGTIPIYSYDAVKYNPLLRHEAQMCLGPLVLDIRKALLQLHDVGFNHCDLRLQNVCFDEQFNVKLIDMDRCSKVGREVRLYPRSCMYNDSFANDTSMDWLQLACIILWVIDDTQTDYHQMKKPNRPPLSCNRFFLQLWESGVFDSTALDEFLQLKVVGKSPLRHVLMARDK